MDFDPVGPGLLTLHHGGETPVIDRRKLGDRQPAQWSIGDLRNRNRRHDPCDVDNKRGCEFLHTLHPLNLALDCGNTPSMCRCEDSQFRQNLKYTTVELRIQWMGSMRSTASHHNRRRLLHIHHFPRLDKTLKPRANRASVDPQRPYFKPQATSDPQESARSC